MTNLPPVHEASYWDERYRRGEDTWDMGTPTPVFVDLLSTHKFEPGATLVLGCGRGHDAVLFASHGFAVTAVDFSRTALDETAALAAERGVHLRLLERDIFTLTPDFDNAFDYVVEYVTFCAVDPLQRSAFADVVGRVLKPGGTFIGLFFPLEERPGGPPFGVSIDEVRSLFSRSCNLLSSVVPQISVKPRQGREALTIWRRRDG
jgi:methyl halide transferase